MQKLEYTQWVFTYSKSTIKTLEQGNVIYSKLTKKKDTETTSLTSRN